MNCRPGLTSEPAEVLRMPCHNPSRRAFLQSAAGAVTCALPFFRSLSVAQALSHTHANVAELDQGNILAAAKAALNAPVRPPASHQFHTEAEANLTTAGATAQPRLLRADANDLRTLSNTVAALAAGYLLTHDDTYARRAIPHLKAWFLDPATRLDPLFSTAGCAPGTLGGTPAGVVDLVPLAELARALSFLPDTLDPDDLSALQAWFTDTQHWLDTNRQAFIAREAKDHRASAWLLVSTGIARFTRDENTLEANRKRFRTHTLRNQVSRDGSFPQEVGTPNPYRNTLFNFDLLTGACQLLSSQFDLLWDFELIDGVGLRIVAAYLYPLIAHPERWEYPADAQHFLDLPGRRPGLLFAGRAYSRPEYVEAWLSAPVKPLAPELAGTLPITQPALWTARAPHGL